MEIRQFAAQYMSEGILNIKITPQKLASMTDMKSSFVEMYYTMMDYDTVYDNNVPLIALVTDLQDEEWRQTVRLLCETVLKIDPQPLFELADEIYGQREELAAIDVTAMIDGAMKMFESENYCRAVFILDIEQADEKPSRFWRIWRKCSIRGCSTGAPPIWREKARCFTTWKRLLTAT